MRFFSKKNKNTGKQSTTKGTPAPERSASAGTSAKPQRSQEPKTQPEPHKKLIGQILVEENYISKDQLNEALRLQKQNGKRLVEVLVDLGHVEQQAFEQLMGSQPGVASIDLDHYTISNDLIAMIPRDFAVKNQVFPIDKLGKLLTVGMACPLDTKTISALQEMTGLRVKALLCSLEDINACIEQYYVNAGDGQPD